MAILYQELLIYYGEEISEALVIMIATYSLITLLNKQSRCSRLFVSNFKSSDPI